MHVQYCNICKLSIVDVDTPLRSHGLGTVTT